jgi:hypothetical protein
VLNVQLFDGKFILYDFKSIMFFARSRCFISLTRKNRKNQTSAANQSMAEKAEGGR